MKAASDAIIHQDQANYLDKLLPPSDALVLEMERHAAENNVPIADPEVARFLEITARAMGARRALEIGMAIGYSVVHLLRGMPDDGLVVSIEPSDTMISIAEDFFARLGMSDRVQIERGKALDVMPMLSEQFDIIYLDAVKEEYGEYLRLGLPLLRRGGVVIADNVLWGGQVAGEIRGEDQRASTEALREFNREFVNHPELRSVVLSFGDGVAYGVKR
jgi:caffeoyl-CoA O-methyltransferase